MSQDRNLSFFPSPSLDHAFAGLGAGVVAVLCMHPLDLLKVRYQISTTPPKGSIGKQIWLSLSEIYSKGGVRGLYRGVGPNIAGNASSWGLYFLFYNMLKRRKSSGEKLSAGQYLLYSAEASAATAIITNPIWVIKVRMFTTHPSHPTAYRNLWHGLSSTYKSEGLRGLYKGTSLALFGVGNGALQFMAYEKMKDWGFSQKRKSFAKAGKSWSTEDDKLSNTSYTLMSGASKLLALSLTYPYQVIRSRIQNNATAHLYPTILVCIRRTYAGEGLKGFYRGLAPTFIRVLPGTCVTFVVYENLAWLLRLSASRRDAKGSF